MNQWNRRSWRRERTGKMAICCILSASVLTVQLPGYASAAEVLEFAGTTQISATEVYPEFDVSPVELAVEEVYVSSGSYVQEGTQILKLTQESWQEALDYYAAAIIRAQNI